MDNIYITMNDNGNLNCMDSDGGHIEEMNARQLIISLNSFFRSSVISYFTISFEPYGLGKKIVTDNIYKTGGSGDVYYSAQHGTITCPVFDYVTVSPKVSLQIDGYEIDENSDVCAIYKSGILDLHFSESLVGEKIIPDSTNADLKLSDKISQMIEEKLDSAVFSTSNIDNDAITSEKITVNAVTSDKIATNAVDTDQIEDAAVTTAKIDDSAVTNVKIANGAVSASKLSSEVIESLGKADTALQPDDISGKADLSDLPTSTSDLDNDSGYLTAYNLLNYVDLSSSQSLTGNKAWLVDNVLTVLIDKGDTTDGGKLVCVKIVDPESEHPTVFSTHYRSGNIVNGGKILTLPSSADGTIALTSDIPTKTSDLQNDSGFITSGGGFHTASDISSSIAAKYTKPLTGIPKTDLASDVQTSLEKADTALQTHQDISGKQDVLTAGANITISNNTISATDTTYSLATGECAGLMSIHDKRKINGIESGAQANVQANWNETDISSDAYIINKPIIPTVPTNLSSFTDDLGTSPAHTHSQYLTSHQDMSGKEDTSNKVTAIDTASPSSTKYPSESAVVSYVIGLVGDIDTILDTINGEVI